ncbi:MAG: nitronate monooxygenase [Candidatus Saganbacteria bacterium]|nr:nitronate monooxygenase [Candidatus Saganbacteria bacterium]
MNLPKLKIGRLVADLPIVQGGMAIRISTGALAGAVAKTGAVGVIGASGLAFEELAKEIRLAKRIAGGRGIVATNIMFAAREFVGLVNTALGEEIDLIFTGAGFSRDIFKMAKGTKTEIVPIVSSVGLAKISKRLGAPAIVVEGKEAGGHLGTMRSIKEILPEIREAVGPDLPIIGAGGFYDGKQIAEFLKLGANAVQIATRFVLAEECNAARAYKEVYQKATKDDVVFITSPVGMPGHAIKNSFVKKILDKTVPRPAGCDYCLKNCSLVYCIIQALINAQQGDLENGIVFSGENVWKIKNRTIRPAAEIIKDILKEYETADE